MKSYDLIVIGTGSVMNIVEAFLQREPEKKVAVIDKDEPGGICLTRGCIPTKILVYPAEVLRIIEGAEGLGILAPIKHVDFQYIMERMRSILQRDIGEIRESLKGDRNIDYYPSAAEFVSPYQLKVQEQIITAKMIFLCLGSRPLIPPIEGLAEIPYHTSDTVLKMKDLPPSIAILGGGYIAAEFGHFFSAMGSEVTIIGRNPRFLPAEEPEVSELAKRMMSAHMTILTDHEVVEVGSSRKNKKTIIALERSTGTRKKIETAEVLVAVGRTSNTDILKPEKGGIRTDERGWVAVNEYMETSRPNVWAMGDAVGKHLFKHVANYESKIVYYNAVLGEKVKVNYDAVPHAVFTHPEIASVGMKQKEAARVYGNDAILIGFHRFQDTAKGEAMGIRDGFVKVILEGENERILGAHVIGPHASVLIQEIITLMYSSDGSMRPIIAGMHIHPSLSEVVERAFFSLMPVSDYDHMMKQRP
jgi:dihydrolipoamide dehydrogenase